MAEQIKDPSTQAVHKWRTLAEWRTQHYSHHPTVSALQTNRSTGNRLTGQLDGSTAGFVEDVYERNPHGEVTRYTVRVNGAVVMDVQLDTH